MGILDSLKDLFNKELLEVEFILNDANQISKISNLVDKKGKTDVKIKIKGQKKDLVFKLKNKRLVDRKSINKLKNQDISYNIH